MTELADETIVNFRRVNYWQAMVFRTSLGFAAFAANLHACHAQWLSIIDYQVFRAPIRFRNVLTRHEAMRLDMR
jgi:hypothetical protein